MADDSVAGSGCSTGTKRAANLSSSERQLLFDLAMVRANIIENKRTDGATTREKEAAWMALAVEFNAASMVKRDHRQLKQVISEYLLKWLKMQFSWLSPDGATKAEKTRNISFK